MHKETPSNTEEGGWGGLRFSRTQEGKGHQSSGDKGCGDRRDGWEGRRAEGQAGQGKPLALAGRARGSVQQALASLDWSFSGLHSSLAPVP